MTNKSKYPAGFVPKKEDVLRSMKKDTGLQSRIDAVVAKAKADEEAADLYDGDNIFRNRMPLRKHRSRMRSVKLG